MPHTLPVALIVNPARARQVAADDALERQHLQPAHEHGPAGEVGIPGLGREVRGSIDSWWLGTISAVWSNQNRESPVRTRPLSGIGVGMTTSKAEMRSEATRSRRPSPAS